MEIKEIKASESLYKLIKLSEGVHDGDLSEIGLQPKLCPAGWWTVGWGHRLDLDHSHTISDVYARYPEYANLTLEQADNILASDVNRREVILNAFIKVNELDFTQNQFDAVLDFIYNFSLTKFASSTLLKRIKFGGDIKEAFLMWNKMRVNGELVEAKGLTIRRTREADLFLTGNFA